MNSLSREERLFLHPYKQTVGETYINTVHAFDWIIMIQSNIYSKYISPSMYHLNNNNNISATIYYQHYLNNILK